MPTLHQFSGRSLVRELSRDVQRPLPGSVFGPSPTPPPIIDLIAYLQSLGAYMIVSLQNLPGAPAGFDFGSRGVAGTLNSVFLGAEAPRGERTRGASFNGSSSNLSWATGNDLGKNQQDIAVGAIIKPAVTAASQVLYGEECNGGAGNAGRYRLSLDSSQKLVGRSRPANAETGVNLTSDNALTLGRHILAGADAHINAGSSTQTLWLAGALLKTAAASFSGTKFENADGDVGPTIGRSPAAATAAWLAGVATLAFGLRRLMTAAEWAMSNRKAVLA